MIKRLISVLILWSLAGVAFSAGPPVFKYTIGSTQYTNMPIACTAQAKVYGTAMTGNVTGVPPAATTCWVKDGGGNAYGNWNFLSQHFCYDGGSRNTGVAWDLQCAVAAPAGYGEAPPDCSSIAEYKSGYITVTGTVAAPGALPKAFGRCMVKDVILGSCAGIPGGQTVCNFFGKNTGVVSTANAATTTSDATAAAAPRVNMPPTSAGTSGTCPGGSVAAGVDSGGTTICMGSGTTPPAPAPAPTVQTKPVVTTTNADGSTSTVAETNTTNIDGSITKTTLKTDTAADGTKTTSGTASTGTNTAGAAGRTDVPTDKIDLCKVNPNLAICQNSTVSGSCAAIACTGDAIQCAQLRAAAAMECKGRADEDAVKASASFGLGTSAMAGTDPLKSTFPTVAGASIVQAPSTLDASGWLGGGACFSDKTITVQGKSVLIPLSKYCDYLLTFRYALMAVAALVSFKILSGAVLT